MSKKKGRLPTTGSEALEVNPFASLSLHGLKPGPAAPPVAESEPVRRKSRGRLEIKREKSGRGGKTVTVVYGMQNIEMREREKLLKNMKNTCGAGGAIKGGTLEVQGDNRETVQRILEESGFQVVLAGG